MPQTEEVGTRRDVKITQKKGALGPLSLDEIRVLRQAIANHLLGTRPLPEAREVLPKVDAYLDSIIQRETTAGNRY